MQLSWTILPLPCQRIDDRPSDDRHIEYCAIFDLALERIGRVIAESSSLASACAFERRPQLA